MADHLINKLGLPQSCYLGKRVFKKLFLEHGSCTAGDKKALRDDVSTITWLYTLKPATIQIKPYQDDFCEYLEIAVLEVTMKSQHSPKRLAEVIHRAIPYPLLLVFNFNNFCALSVAPKRFSQAEKGAIVADEFFTTEWIETLDLTTPQEAFFNSLNVRRLLQTHLLDFYNSWIERFLAMDSARLTGVFRLESSQEDLQNRKQRLEQCHALEAEIANLRGNLHKEPQFAVKVDLNTKIKQLELELKQQARML